MPNENGTFTPEEVEELKLQLGEELKARDEKIAELGTQLLTITELTTERDQLKADLTTEREALKAALTNHTVDIESLKTNLTTAVAKYQGLLLASNPTIPAELIQGASIDELNSSVENARALVSKIREQVVKEAEATRVPPGAPPRTGVEVEALSPTEKIKYGLRR